MHNTRHSIRIAFNIIRDAVRLQEFEEDTSTRNSLDQTSFSPARLRTQVPIFQMGEGSIAFLRSAFGAIGTVISSARNEQSLQETGPKA